MTGKIQQIMEEIQKWFEMKTRNVQEIIDGIPMSVWTIWKMDQEILCLLRFQDIKEKIAKDRKVIPDPIDDRKFQEWKEHRKAWSFVLKKS